MEEQEKHKLERYLKNSTRFLWGLGPGNQKDNYKWLRDQGFEFNNGTYDNVTNQLVEGYGIEEVIKRLVVLRVKELYTSAALNLLKEHWYAGSRPDYSFINHYGIGTPTPFLEVNNQFKFVERWGELAGIWFEEIDLAPEFRWLIYQ